MSLILVDGSALFYRAYYAFARRPLRAPSGELTSVAFGFLNSLLLLLEQYRPSHLAVVFDLPGKTFRHEIYPDYKAHRKPMPEDLAEQLPRLRELLQAWGLGISEKQGFEGDDVMASLAVYSREVCDRVWFYTGDKDFMQLLDTRCGMLKPGRQGDDIRPYTPVELRRDYGLEPTDLIEVFALSGDKSDNIPGAPGVGEKTALKLIQQYGNLETLYTELPASSLTPRIKRVLTENRDQVFLSRDLFRIRQNVQLDPDWDRFRTRLPVEPRFTELLQELGLRRIVSRLQRLADSWQEDQPVPDPPAVETIAKESPAEAAAEPPNLFAEKLGERGYELLRTEAELQRYLAKLGPAHPVAVDTETDGLRTDQARLVGISLAAASCPPAYLPVLIRLPDPGGDAGEGTLFPVAGEKSQLDWIRPALGPVLADPARMKVGQNLKFDEWILTRHGMPLSGPRFDTMVAAYVLDPGRQRYKLDELVADFLGEEPMPYAALFEPNDRQRDILAVPLEKLAYYAAEDADVTWRLWGVLNDALGAAGQESLFGDVEMPLSEVLFRMERRGIRVDTDFLAGLSRRFEKQLDHLVKEIHAIAGEPFNVQSPKQLAHILFEKIKLKPVKKTATGLSTDVSVLTALADEHPLPALVLEHRQLAKLQNTYVESLPELVNRETGLIHTSYNQAVAATGRLSSSEPNLQNIPIRSESGRLIRQAFVPRSNDNLFLSADYSQIELRLLAHLSGDEALHAAFAGQGDVHRRTAALINGVGEDEVTSEMRSRAKAINFGVIYGMGAVALGKQISVPTREAKAFIETYFATYPGVKRFIEETKEKARREGFVETLLGRRRPLPDIHSADNRLRSFQERIAVNTPIQGTAADLIKLAMIRIDRELSEEGLASMLLLQVHDELVLEVPSVELDRVRDLVRHHMENVFELAVPLVVDLHVGHNWAEAHG